MVLIEFDEVKWADPEGKPPLKISVALPREHPKGDYACRVSVDGLSIKVDKEQIGVTKAQAICLSLRLVIQTIIGCAEYRKGELVISLLDGTIEPLSGEMIGAGVFEKTDW